MGVGSQLGFLWAGDIVSGGLYFVVVIIEFLFSVGKWQCLSGVNLSLFFLSSVYFGCFD